MFRSDLCVHKVIKGWSNFQTAWFTDIELLEEVYRAVRDSAGIVHAIEGPVVHISTGRKRGFSIPNLTNDHYSIVMQPVGLRGADAMPKDEAQLARAAHGCLHGLAALHKVTLWVCMCSICLDACHLHQLQGPCKQLSQQLQWSLCNMQRHDTDVVLQHALHHASTPLPHT